MTTKGLSLHKNKVQNERIFSRVPVELQSHSYDCKITYFMQLIYFLIFLLLECLKSFSGQLLLHRAHTCYVTFPPQITAYD